MNKKYLFPIKLISIALITSAIFLEIYNIYYTLNHREILTNLSKIFWLERFALISHFVEAIIAAYLASFKNQQPLKYGVYTFFVGTVGLLELLSWEDKVNS
ncbi:MAG: hypothetical protein AAF378_09790 [Cyanobacteria bacterium P01_A01_bin.84]